MAATSVLTQVTTKASTSSKDIYNPPFLQKVFVWTKALPIPVIVLGRFLRTWFTEDERHKPWRRITGDAIFRWHVYTQQIRHMVYIGGPSIDVYKKWSEGAKSAPLIESIEGGGPLYWMGPPKADKIVLYIHGGGFALPLAIYSVDFWGYFRGQFSFKDNIQVSVACLDYTLMVEDNSSFPVPVHQSVLAVQHILNSGVHPSDLYLAGDSAGGNLVVQVLLHMIHPYPSIPVLPQGAKLAGAFLISPWVVLLPKSEGSFGGMYDNIDIISSGTIKEFADWVVSGLQDPDKMLPYMDSRFGPEGWYDGLEDVVERVLISIGGAEVLRDSILEFSERVEKVHKGTTTIMDKHGLHDEVLLDFLVPGEKKFTEMSSKMFQWFREGFTRKGSSAT
ncbi:Alpha/Beta hydrolase protein [Panaeolus papilionaceus]|nr:Alpha/Beta hydrolase protein [Panaeolus papilionaceus]